jgi:hypothetical protein
VRHGRLTMAARSTRVERISSVSDGVIASMAILLRADRPVDAAYEAMTKDVASLLAAHHHGLPAESMVFASANPYAPATLTHQTETDVHQEASLGRDLARIAASTPMAIRAVVQFGRRGTTAALRTRYARAETRSAMEILRKTERLAGRITT